MNPLERAARRRQLRFALVTLVSGTQISQGWGA